MRAGLIVVFALMLATSVAEARMGRVPTDRVREVPVERLLTNIERNSNGLNPAQKARAIGRLHLIAYLRRVETLPAYDERPSEFAEGRIDDCAETDARSFGFGEIRPFPKRHPGELCEERQYSYASQEPEVPRVSTKPPANVHLAAAINAYEQARRLEPGNLRTRLALAYAYDCAGRLEDARGELRYVVRRGLAMVPMLAGKSPDGRDRIYPVEPARGLQDSETYLVLKEAVTHFTAIATTLQDKQLIAALWDHLKRVRPFRFVTPIFVPLVADADFVAFVDRASDVAFDYSGQGEKMRLGWLSDKAAWLVWDPRGTGRIDSGFQMFGSVTWIAFWENGYLPLGSLDDNGDGKIAGKELRGLALWRDANGDGVSDAGEVKPLAAYKIVALRFGYERVDSDMWIAKRGVEFANGETRPTYDWLLHEAQVRTVGD